MFDLILANGNIIDVKDKKIYHGNIFIKDGIIAGIGHSPNRNAKKIIDIANRFISPGFIDFHLHIESSMLSPIEFAKAAITHGTTAIFVDPHEIANVCGRKGIELFLEQSELVPLDMYVGIPSCVPATQLETSGATITISDIKELISDKRIYGLAEMMNFPGVIYGFGDAREKVNLVFNAKKIVDGHCPGVIGKDLLTYISNGKNDNTVRIMSDHETGNFREAIEKSKVGMYVGLRYGSASKDMERILPELIKEKISLDNFMLCSDDLDPIELYEKGHVDRIIKRARDIIRHNSAQNLETATISSISMATLIPGIYLSKFFKLQNLPEMGEISVGKKANLVVFDSLEKIEIDKVILTGTLMVDQGEFIGEKIDYDYSAFMGKVNIGRKIQPDDFKIKVSQKVTELNVKVIEIITNSIETENKILIFSVSDNELKANPERDIAKIAVFERHHASGNYSLGFVKGLGIKKGALASTIAHDSHNVIVAGVDDDCMARAVNCLSEKGGGMVVVTERMEYFPLKIGGLMSTSPLEEVVRKYKHIKDMVHKIGPKTENTFMIMAFLALPVIPKLKITDKGLVNVDKFEFVNLY